MPICSVKLYLVCVQRKRWLELESNALWRWLPVPQYGQGGAGEFIKQAKGAGLVVGGHEFTTDKSTDFAAFLTAPQAYDVEAIFFRRYAPHGAPMAPPVLPPGPEPRLVGRVFRCRIRKSGACGAGPR